MSVLFFTCFSIKYRRKITALQVYIFSFMGIIFLLLLFFQAKLKTSRTESNSLRAAVFCSEGFSVFYAILVHRFVNNYTNRVGCGFECAGLKTQA